MSRPASLDLPDIKRATSVSKTINRVFDYADRPLPPEISKSFCDLQALNPEYHHRVFSGPEMDEYVREFYPGRVYKAFSRLRSTYKAARADLFRYLLIYREGGVYLDVKSTATRPLRETIRDADVCILSHWDNGPDGQYASFGLHPELRNTEAGEFQNWFLICAQGHPFLRAVIERVVSNIENYKPWRDGVSRPGSLRVNGPIAMTLGIEPQLRSESFRIVQNERELGFVYTIYDHFLEHTRLTPHHYHWNRDSVVKPRGADLLTFAAFQGWSKIVSSPKTGALLSRLGILPDASST